MKLGLIRENKIPNDRRVALTPEQCKTVIGTYGVDVVVQPSDSRSFVDDEYLECGIPIQEDISDCDILLGVKEVPVNTLIANKTYLFFSHTIKKQESNRKMLQAILEKNIRLIDYECIRNHIGQRVVAFGRWAGIVGAYNMLKAYGIKYGLYDLKAARDCYNLEELFRELTNVKLPTINILLTGGGRVAQGAQEIFGQIGIKKVERDEFLNKAFEEATYIQLDSDDYNERLDGTPFDFKDFYKQPDCYRSTFKKYLRHTDVLLAGAYWDPRAPKLFELSDISSSDFKIRLVADVTCDIKGSIPTTIRPSTIDDPFYDIERTSKNEVGAFSNQDNITVMAIDNLPCELPRDSSHAFGEMLIEHAFPQLLKEDKGMIKNATITENGTLTEPFKYLADYIQ